VHPPALFRDRRDAGRQLAAAVRRNVVPSPAVIVLGLPRGGVPVAAEVARLLYAPLDVLCVAKLGVPGHEELAMGAAASGGAWVLNDDVLMQLGIGRDVVDATLAQAQAEIARRDRAFRGDRLPIVVGGKTVVIVDDGLATGATMRAGIAALRRLRPARIVAAVPVAARESAELVEKESDAFIVLAKPEPFHGVGMWYGAFPQLDDAAVRALLGT
jgi:predicted phosphoribosyltransferase